MSFIFTTRIEELVKKNGEEKKGIKKEKKREAKCYGKWKPSANYMNNF